LLTVLKQGLVIKSDPTLSAKEIAKQKTELALAKKKCAPLLPPNLPI
jgi:hypothetical protein